MLVAFARALLSRFTANCGSRKGHTNEAPTLHNFSGSDPLLPMGFSVPPKRAGSGFNQKTSRSLVTQARVEMRSVATKLEEFSPDSGLNFSEGQNRDAGADDGGHLQNP